MPTRFLSEAEFAQLAGFPAAVAAEDSLPTSLSRGTTCGG